MNFLTRLFKAAIAPHPARDLPARLSKIDDVRTVGPATQPPQLRSHQYHPINAQNIRRAVEVCQLLSKGPDKPHLMRVYVKHPRTAEIDGWGWVCASQGCKHGGGLSATDAYQDWLGTRSFADKMDDRGWQAADWAIRNRRRMAAGQWDGVTVAKVPQ